MSSVFLILCHYPRGCHLVLFSVILGLSYTGVLLLLSALFTSVTHALQTTTASVHGMKGWKGVCAITSRIAKVSLWDHHLVVPSCTLLTSCFVALSAEIDDSIGVKRLSLGISSYLSGNHFASKPDFYRRSRREQNRQLHTKFMGKEPHFHQQFHSIYVFLCHPRFAFFILKEFGRE